MTLMFTLPVFTSIRSLSSCQASIFGVNRNSWKERYSSMAGRRELIDTRK